VKVYLRSVAIVATAVAIAIQTQLACAEANHWRDEGRAAVAEARSLGSNPTRAKNVILFVGDGMGLSSVTAARILEGQLRGQPGEENQLSFERFPHVALAKTYNTNQQIPDSAGTMTALVTGAKTRAGVLSVDETVELGDFAAVDGHRLTTIVEEAEDRGLSTGLVTTTSVTHATPAALYGHSPERRWESDIHLSAEARAAGFPDLARQLIEFDHGDGLEVVLGGGEQYFRPSGPAASEFWPAETPQKSLRTDGRDLTTEWVTRRQGSAYVRTCAELDALKLDETAHLLGLFAPKHLRYEADRAKGTRCQPSLTQMTTAALSILERNSRGYFLMVEGGKIDHAHHNSNAYRALTDLIEFARAVDAAAERTDANDTLIVVTADHGHVFTIAGYPTRGNDILGLVVGNDTRGNPAKEFSRDGLGLPYTTLGYHNGPGYPGATAEQPEGAKHFPHNTSEFHGVTKGRPDLSAVDTTDPDFLQEAAIPMSDESHSGEDVPIYARGPSSQLFHGVQEQSYVYHAMVEALGWNLPTN
jgi:alkaline phosphatase